MNDSLTRRIIPAILFLLFVHAFAAAQSASISGIINLYTPVVGFDGCNGVIVQDRDGYSVGDTVLIIQMKGADIDRTNSPAFGGIVDYRNAGNYEFGIIARIEATTITLRDLLTRRYSVEGLVQLVRVPHYASATVTGRLTAKPWNGLTGGLLALDVAGDLTLADTIDISGLGFRGGAVSVTNADDNHTDYFYTMASGLAGRKGESVAEYETPYEAGRGALASGGGGGNCHNAGGGGGGNSGAGGLGGKQWNGAGSVPLGGLGGRTLDTGKVVNRVFLGGGGGGGHQNNAVGTPGGNGGGIMIARAGRVIGNGRPVISDGLGGVVSGNDGAGGGGSGGSVLIESGSINGLSVFARGGAGGGANNAGGTDCHGTGGGGGGGSLRVSGANLPAGVIANLSGGVAGLEVNSNSNCYGTTYGADSGRGGAIITGLHIPMGSTLFPPLAPVVSADTSICIGGSTVLEASGGVEYRWTPARGLSCTECARPTATPDSSTRYFVKLIYPNGCVAFDSVDVTLLPLPVIVHGPDVAICPGDSARLSVEGGERYLWSPLSGLSCADCADPVARPDSTTLYHVTVANRFGCVAEDSVTVIVTSLPVPSISGGGTICAGTSAPLVASGGVGYRWFADAGLSCLDCADPVARPDSTTTYTVVVTGASGCTAVDSVRLVVAPLPVVKAFGDTAICRTEETRISASGAAGYRWAPAEGLSCTDCPDPIAHPTVTTIYTVTGTSADGCTGTDSVAVTVLPRGHIAARIDRDLTVFPGKGIRVPIVLESAIDVPSLDSFDLLLRYDPRVLLLDSITTTGTVTQGWRRSGGVINRFTGTLTDRFIAPRGSRPGDGRVLLLLNFRGFVGDADSSDIPFSITPYTYRCADPSGGNGLVRLDSICGLSHRLIELVAPFRYALDGNQPNPFYPDTKIHFSLGLDGMTSLTIYDVAGKEVARPVAGYMEPGNYAVSWDAAGLPTGVYYYRLVSGEWAQSGTMILAR